MNSHKEDCKDLQNSTCSSSKIYTSIEIYIKTNISSLQIAIWIYFCGIFQRQYMLVVLDFIIIVNNKQKLSLRIMKIIGIHLHVSLWIICSIFCCKWFVSMKDQCKGHVKWILDSHLGASQRIWTQIVAHCGDLIFLLSKETCVMVV